MKSFPRTPGSRPADCSVLIAGAGGLLGRSLTALLTNCGWQVEPLTHQQLDITDGLAVRERVSASSPAVIINCAATADVDRCEREPAWAYSINEAGPRLLARAANETGAEIVHLSTDYVFGGKKDSLYTQDDEPDPLSEYGKSKLAGELAVRDEAERAYVVRTSWIFGAGGKNFGSRVIEYARKGAQLKGVADQISIPTYAPDLAGRIKQIVERGISGVYHVTNSGPATWYEFARMALDLSGLANVEIEPVSRKDLNQAAPRPRYSAMRCALSERLGLTPLRHWSSALHEFVSSYPAG